MTENHEPTHEELLALQPQPQKRGFLASLRASFLTGLIVISPIALTLWLMWTVAGWVDGWVLPFIPADLKPESYVGTNLRGVGVVFFLVFTVLIGALAKNFIGRAVIRFGEGVVDRMPVVRSVYNGVKQIAETVLSQGDTKFDRACVIEYPRPGLRAIAFVSSKAKGELAKIAADGDSLVSVFLPTTPNPTSGFLLYVPESQITYLEMSVEDAAKLIISAGLVYPAEKKPVEKSAAEKKPAKTPEAA